jgi:hypothetical protein
MDSLTTTREQDISNIVKEDVLRILCEEKEKTSSWLRILSISLLIGCFNTAKN